VAVACFSCSNLSLSKNCTFASMPKSVSKGKESAKTAKTRALLRSEASEREIADNKMFTCPTCKPLLNTVMRARNLRYHMSEMHNLWCETLHQTISFPQPDSTFRTLTAEEYEIYGHGKPLPKVKAATKHVPNRIVSDDDIEDGDVCLAPNIGPLDPLINFRSTPLSSVSSGSKLPRQKFKSTCLLRSTCPHRRADLMDSQM